MPSKQNIIYESINSARKEVNEDRENSINRSDSPKSRINLVDTERSIESSMT